MTTRNNFARAIAQAKRRGSRHLHGVDPRIVDQGLRLGGSPALRRADRAASVRPPETMKREMSPIGNPKAYRQELLKLN